MLELAFSQQMCIRFKSYLLTCFLPYLLTYLLTQWSRVLLEKVIGSSSQVMTHNISIKGSKYLANMWRKWRLVNVILLVTRLANIKLLIIIKKLEKKGIILELAFLQQLCCKCRVTGPKRCGDWKIVTGLSKGRCSFTFSVKKCSIF